MNVKYNTAIYGSRLFLLIIHILSDIFYSNTPTESFKSVGVRAVITHPVQQMWLKK